MWLVQELDVNGRYLWEGQYRIAVPVGPSNAIRIKIHGFLKVDSATRVYSLDLGKSEEVSLTYTVRLNW